MTGTPLDDALTCSVVLLDPNSSHTFYIIYLIALSSEMLSMRSVCDLFCSVDASAIARFRKFVITLIDRIRF